MIEAFVACGTVILVKTKLGVFQMGRGSAGHVEPAAMSNIAHTKYRMTVWVSVLADVLST